MIGFIKIRLSFLYRFILIRSLGSQILQIVVRSTRMQVYWIPLFFLNLKHDWLTNFLEKFELIVDPVLIEYYFLGFDHSRVEVVTLRLVAKHVLLLCWLWPGKCKPMLRVRHIDSHGLFSHLFLRIFLSNLIPNLSFKFWKFLIEVVVFSDWFPRRLFLNFEAIVFL